MSLEALNQRVKTDLSYLNYGAPSWVSKVEHPDGHVYDVVIIGGGQSGLGAAFGLLRERISNILVIDENEEGYEGPWDTYARMVTLRTPKHLTPIDLGIPSLTFRSFWEAQFGTKGWDALDKIPKGEWMNYLRWYRNVLSLPVLNKTSCTLIEPTNSSIHRIHILKNNTEQNTLLARKVILATGIQGGGEWHIPSFVSHSLPKHLYAHTSEQLDIKALKNKKVAILGGGASAFDNANHLLSSGVGEAHVFVRRHALPTVNPIRQMEISGMIERFHVLSDRQKYQVMAHFFKNNQPPTNDTFERASSKPGFQLHLGTTWEEVTKTENGIDVVTTKGTMSFDFLIVSTGLLTNPALRPELRLVEKHIARWKDYYTAPSDINNPVLNAHPYLSKGFAFTSRDKAGEKQLHGIFSFNYAAILSCGLSASAISGTKHSIPKLVAAVADQLFQDHSEENITNFLNYKEVEFNGEWPKASSSPPL